MEELNKIDESLNQLHTEFNNQLHALGSDTKEFHSALIDLSAKYPDHKELLQFIVFINDKLETNQQLFSSIVVESFNELVNVKKSLVQKIIQDKEEQNKRKEKTEMSVWERVKTSGALLKNIKTVLTTLAIILLAAAVIIAPDMFIEVLKYLAKVL